MDGHFNLLPTAAFPFDLRQSLGLAVVADFDHGGRDQDDSAHYGRNRQCDLAIGGAHIGMDTTETRCDHESRDAQQQADGEGKQGQEDPFMVSLRMNDNPSKAAKNHTRKSRLDYFLRPGSSSGFT